MPILINLLTPFGAYLAAEHIGASGILARWRPASR
jgi:NhaP-type Na+/H+ or K+/H+ antiporter